MSNTRTGLLSLKRPLQLCLAGMTLLGTHSWASTLENGQPISDLSGSSGSQSFFNLNVPQDASNLNISISGGSGDADLYVNFGSSVSESDWDCRPYRSGNNEQCSFATPEAGNYAIMLDAWSAYSGVTLTASYDLGTTPPPPPATGVQNISAAGDSITRAFAADCTGNVWFWDLWCLLGGDQPEHSWFDGWDNAVDSVHDKYKRLDSNIGANKDAATTGAEMFGAGDQGSEPNFAEQAAAIVTQSPLPDHVEVILGGNDICNRNCIDPANCSDPLYSESEWRGAVRAGLDTLMQGLPQGSTVLLGSVPRVQHLRQAGLDKQASSSAINCESLWSTYDVCQIVTAGGTYNNESLSTRLNGVAQAQRLYNRVLAEEAAAYNANTNGQNPNGIEVVSEYVDENTPSAGTFVFGADNIDGGDCFHPNVATQGTIADFIWNANPDK
ncbi:pre-peptidase C-terminal domain-containing protein [Shewanella submarina]|uniref:Pre-peptidase C-terminal domain-containing protein n=1 Tax=Shewanella submarina TaxID=2016376 RepID=A0ABV7GF57_9GAMM|nr:pre-peptidase C-terminal domain-containing protein [Shewanella submarina]MCL1035652.1 pre-peptidase C-terminal domain-containing protein [Shewanella submarina]